MKRKIAKLLFIIGTLPSVGLISFSCANNELNYDNSKMNNQKESKEKTNNKNVVSPKTTIQKINDSLRVEENIKNKESKSKNNDQENVKNNFKESNSNNDSKNTTDIKNKNQTKEELDETDLYWLRKKYNDEILGLFNSFSHKYITETLNNWWREKNNIDESKENKFKEKIQKLIEKFTVDLSVSNHNFSEIEKMMNNAIKELLKLSDEISKIIKEKDTQNKEYLNQIFDKKEKLISIYNLIYLKTLKESYDFAFKERKMNIDQSYWSNKLKENVDKINSEIKNNESEDWLQKKTVDILKLMLNGQVIEENN
ncbi:hypothetical protein KQ876_01560 [Mycoplasma sp. CSL7491-lung]|uniref:hypothetical protein n=1 Tax=Mycoplasma sp. CSL7491-lung TaxID=549718 RepID=UPI001C0FB734|nr:hypothetical protein [Mycoplasma sp. CSL7491-lung]MBU4692893.1 hypothetical protein [Mycoplasma sp. CSL7491-lung]